MPDEPRTQQLSILGIDKGEVIEPVLNFICLKNGFIKYLAHNGDDAMTMLGAHRPRIILAEPADFAPCELKPVLNFAGEAGIPIFASSVRSPAELTRKGYHRGQHYRNYIELPRSVSEVEEIILRDLGVARWQDLSRNEGQ